MLGVNFILSIVFLLNALIVPCSTVNDESLCTNYHRILATRLESYRQSYWHDGFFIQERRWRTNYVKKSSEKWETTYTCCVGYEPSFWITDKVTCHPVCASGCDYGNCYRPNECLCSAGYVSSIDASSQQSHCVPDCPSGCHGGTCTMPDECTCESGYRFDLESGSCEASCLNVGNGDPQGCGGNATCISPDTCQCDTGYIVVDVSASSTSSNDDQTTTSRDIDTTTWSSDVDKPTFTTSGIVCAPLCNPKCGKNANCVAPDECQCDEGYGDDSLNDHQTNRSGCVPICKNSCVNGFCSNPGECTCFSGYQPHHHHGFVCDPFCSQVCIHGKCALPNYCECNDGYEKLSLRVEGGSENVCVPICSGQCLNGYCVAPGMCLCNPGYVYSRTQTNGTAIGDTSDGNISVSANKDLFEQHCTPTCKPPCSNGSLCTAPNQCQSPDKASQDCGSNGVFSKLEDKCVCKYEWTDLRCTEYYLCSIVIPNTNDTLTIPNRFIFLKNATTDLNYHNEDLERNEEFDWDGPECNNTCRFAMMSSSSAGTVVDITASCYWLHVLNATVGLVFTTDQHAGYQHGHKLRICFVDPVSTCDTIQSGTSKSIVGGAIGMAVLFAFVVALGLGIYFRRIRRNQNPCELDSTFKESDVSECTELTMENVYS